MTRSRFIFAFCTFALILTVSGADAAKKSDKTAKPQEPVATDTSLDNLKDAPPPPTLACEGPFAKDSTHAKLEASFGAKQVTYKDVPTTNDAITKASVVFDDDPTRRIVVYWKDNKARAKPAAVAVDAPSTWKGPGGVRNGLSLKEVAKLNEDDFKVTGFGGIGGGEISGLKGAFINLPGDCSLMIRLEPGIANPLPPRFASVTGDVLIASSNLVLRRVRPQVVEWRLKY